MTRQGRHFAVSLATLALFGASACGQQAQASEEVASAPAAQLRAAEPAGLFGWVDTGVDTDVLAQHMLDDGYLLAPGALFHASRNQPSTLMRINFASTQEATFWKTFSKQRGRL